MVRDRLVWLAVQLVRPALYSLPQQIQRLRSTHPSHSPLTTHLRRIARSASASAPCMLLDSTFSLADTGTSFSTVTWGSRLMMCRRTLRNCGVAEGGGVGGGGFA